MLAQLDSDYIKRFPGASLARLLSYAAFEGRPVTTRGQWINPLVRQQATLASRVGPEQEVHDPAFIIGLGRSGTTVLGSLLSVHPEIGFLNEPKLIWNLICPTEDVIGSYSRGSAHYRLEANQATTTLKRRARKIFATYLRCIGRTRLLEKYPEQVFRMDFVKEIFPDARWEQRGAFDRRLVGTIRHQRRRRATRLVGRRRSEVEALGGADPDAGPDSRPDPRKTRPGGRSQ